MSRRVLGFAALFAILFSIVALQAPVSASPSAQASTTVAGIKGTVTAGEVKVHSDPSTVSQTLTTVKLNDVVTVTGRNPSGTWVQILTAGNISGWSGSEFVKLQSGKLSDLTVIDPSALATAAALTGCGTTAPGVATAGGVVKAKVNAASLILRAQPDKAAPELMTLKPGAPLTVLGTSQSGAWFLVSTADGRLGWVGAAYVYLTAGKLVDIKIVDPASVDTSATPVVTMAATMAGTMAADTTMAATACPTTAANTAVVKAAVVVTSLRLRGGPSNTAETLTTLKTGDGLTVKGTSQSGAWLLVETNDGIIGWVGSAFVHLTVGKLIDIPIVSDAAAVSTEVATPAN